VSSVVSELLYASNLLSLSRIPLAPLVGYFLWCDNTASTVIAALLLIVAGITDGLDGYLARRRGTVTRLGVALDPIADKFFALFLVISLILFRNFPVWLAIVIVGRDLLILIGGLILSRREKISLPSSLSGKYAFASIVILLGAYVIRFRFSIELMTPVVLVLIGLSLWGYGRFFYYRIRGATPPTWHDTSTTKTIRIALIVVAAIAHIVMFYIEKLR
jgi:CDP-diacylglycerol--glycerol-3-phosphate 3-phosphatidyltransferase